MANKELLNRLLSGKALYFSIETEAEYSNFLGVLWKNQEN